MRSPLRARAAHDDAGSSPAPAGGCSDDPQARINSSVWRKGNFVRRYTGRGLRPVEVLLLVAHRDELSGRVLEIGCGAGRLTGYLIELATSVVGLDTSPRMVEYCRSAYPGATFMVQDMRDLSQFATASFDAVVAIDNVVDVLNHSERARVLGEIARLLEPGGILIMGTHNRAFLSSVSSPTSLRARTPMRSLGKLVLMPWRLHNHRRLSGYEHAGAGYAIVNDEAHNFRLLHYYVDRDEQERRFREAGLEPLECRGGEGHPLAEGETAAGSHDLHFVARRAGPESS